MTTKVSMVVTEVTKLSDVKETSKKEIKFNLLILIKQKGICTNPLNIPCAACYLRNECGSPETFVDRAERIYKRAIEVYIELYGKADLVAELL